MTKAFQSIGLIAKNGDERVSAVLQSLVELLQERGLDFVLDQRTARALNRWPHPSAEPDVLAARTDLIIAVGGDGTLLNTARMLATQPVPLVGVNLGRLGFLTDIVADRAREEVAAILDGHYARDERHMLSAQVFRGEEAVSGDLALNDVVIQKADGGRMIEFETWVDGTFVSLHRADGMIAATATGSTAYALSGGGPILHPDVDALALVPICPHTLSDRPLVVPGSSRLSFVLKGDETTRAQLNWDGQKQWELLAGDRVELLRSEQITTLLHPPGHDYFALLRSKLHWGRAQEHAVPR